MTNPDDAIERWNAITKKALAADDDHLESPDAESAAWVVAQLVSWPVRIHEDRTMNDRFTRMSVAALAMKALANPTPVMGDDATIIERLEQRWEHPHPRPMGSLVNPDGPEAANRLQQLSAEVSRKDEALREIEDFANQSRDDDGQILDIIRDLALAALSRPNE